MTQTQLADKTGVSPQSIHRIEAGSSWPDYSTLQALAGALDIRETDLINSHGADISKEKGIDGLLFIEKYLKKAKREPLNEDQLNIINLIRYLKPEQISFLRIQINSFLKRNSKKRSPNKK